MQDYLWDGIKRDRLVWIGDMHPETMTIGAVFGGQRRRAGEPGPDPRRDAAAEVDERHQLLLDVVGADPPQLVSAHGDLAYLRAAEALSDRPAGAADRAASARTIARTCPTHRFLDWPSSENKPAIHAGLQSLMMLTLRGRARAVRRPR